MYKNIVEITHINKYKGYEYAYHLDGYHFSNYKVITVTARTDVVITGNNHYYIGTVTHTSHGTVNKQNPVGIF